jgi:hypothetical protein
LVHEKHERHETSAIGDLVVTFVVDGLGFGTTDGHGSTRMDFVVAGRAKFHLSRKPWGRLMGFWFQNHGSTQIEDASVRANLCG